MHPYQIEELSNRLLALEEQQHTANLITYYALNHDPRVLTLIKERLGV